MTKFITNQNIEVKLELASLGDRIVAFLVDALIIVIYFFTVALLFSVFGLNKLIVILFLIPLCFYSLFFETFFNGQSPGKRVRDIKVVRLDGGAPEIANYLLRWIIRPIDIIIYGSIAVISIIITKNGQRLGDLAADTTVIKLRKSIALTDVESLIRNSGHLITFPQVKRLNDKQAEVIRAALHMRRDGFNDRAADEVASKTRDFLKIDSDLPSLKFLYTVLKDYEYYHHGI